MQTELYFKNPPIKYMKTITRLVLIVSLCGCFFVTEAQAAPVSGAAKAAKVIFGGGAINGAKRVKITPPPPSASSGGAYSGRSSVAPWVYGGSRAVNEYQKDQQRQQRGYGYPNSRY